MSHKKSPSRDSLLSRDLESQYEFHNKAENYMSSITKPTCRVREIQNFENVWRRSLILLDKMSSEKFDIRQTYHSEMSSENSKCPAKDSRFAGQNVRQGSNEFRVLLSCVSFSIS